MAWADLVPFEDPLYEHAFTEPAPEWPATVEPDYETTYTPAGYRVHGTGRGVFGPLPAPPTGSASDQVVSATARITSGQGAWGVWCRGVDGTGARSYQFLLSHAGAVQIVEPGGGAPDGSTSRASTPRCP